MTSEDDRTIINSRTIVATPDEILATFRDPERLARWWGPAGFRNTFHEFDFRPGGLWVHDMHGPDGAIYPNRNRFEEIGNGRVVIRHLDPVHAFTLTIEFEPLKDCTRITWTMVFDDAAECERVRPFVPKCNEENLDRLASELEPEES